MKPLFQWVRNNVALSFFFTTEIVCLFYAFVLVIGSYRNVDPPIASASPSTLLIITEQAYGDLVNLEVEEFTHLPASASKVLITSREQAIQAFVNNEQAILILSKPLDNKEMTALQMKSDRLPIHQDVIDNSGMAAATAPVFIHDNTPSQVEGQLAAFLSNDRIQDEIFQKFQQRSSKNSFRKG